MPLPYLPFHHDYEGFGLPLLEAMACGTQAMVAMLVRVLMDEAVQMQLAQKGLERVVSFSWEKCARQTMSVYRYAFMVWRG